jgi:hypothetical protein
MRLLNQNSRAANRDLYEDGHILHPGSGLCNGEESMAMVR